MKLSLGKELREMASEPFKVLHTEKNINELLIKKLLSFLTEVPFYRTIVIVCVGTDRSTGDSLGPIVGTQLSKMNMDHFHLYGTLDEPVHAMNLQDTLTSVYNSHPDAYVIAIDACLGQLTSVGCIQVGSGPVRPGAGVNKELPPVGNMHVTGIVNVGGFMEYFVLQNTRLNLVMKMADIIASTLHQSINHWSRLTAVPFRKIEP
jgi:putative sporulation protein YyaC